MGNIFGQGQSEHWLWTYHGTFFEFLPFYYSSYWLCLFEIAIWDVVSSSRESQVSLSANVVGIFTLTFIVSDHTTHWQDRNKNRISPLLVTIQNMPKVISLGLWQCKMGFHTSRQLCIESFFQWEWNERNSKDKAKETGKTELQWGALI